MRDMRLIDSSHILLLGGHYVAADDSVCTSIATHGRLGPLLLQVHVFGPHEASDLGLLRSGGRAQAILGAHSNIFSTTLTHLLLLSLLMLFLVRLVCHVIEEGILLGDALLLLHVVHTVLYLSYYTVYFIFCALVVVGIFVSLPRF